MPLLADKKTVSIDRDDKVCGNSGSSSHVSRMAKVENVEPSGCQTDTRLFSPEMLMELPLLNEVMCQVLGTVPDFVVDTTKLFFWSGHDPAPQKRSSF